MIAMRKMVGPRTKARRLGRRPMTHRFYPRAAFVLGVGLSWALGGFAAQAADFSAEYVFGDSLSDNGNVAELENVLNFEKTGSFFGNFPDPPSFHDSFTNGNV